MYIGKPSIPPGGEYYVFRDMVHNLISIEDEHEGRAIRRILRTAEVQRLRRIRQTGLSYLVYPSMEHSRFVHALGSYWIAKKTISTLYRNQPSLETDGFPKSLHLTDRHRTAFAIAALLHDVGHLPFSHVWEHFLQHYCPSRQSMPDKPHEILTQSILQEQDTEIGRLLSPSSNDHKEAIQNIDDQGLLKSDILSFIKRTHPLRYLHGLLDGYLDVDRLEFVARDTRTAGVTYGFHELDWLVPKQVYALAETLSSGIKRL